MKILFDYQAFVMQTHGGVSRCFAELCTGLRAGGDDCILGIKESDNLYLRESGLVPDLKPAGYRYKKWFGHEQYFHGEDRLKRFVFNAVGYSIMPNPDYCIKLLRRQFFDVFHPTFFNPYFLDYLEHKPFVLTIHDMIPELYPQYFDADDIQVIGKQILAPKASAIIAVSEKTKEDIVSILHVPEEKVHVIYHGCSFEKPSNLHRFYEFQYLLYVGDRNRYKDFIPFVQSAASILKKYDELKLVCTGRPFTTFERTLFESLGISDRVVYHRVKDDAEFYSLYHFAACFIYSSEYEGFGIPILEAYASDCPVLLNNASCFPEIAGDAAVYFSFGRQGDLNEKLEYMLSMPSCERESLIQKQRDRLLRYSWGKSARQLVGVYKSIV